MYYNKYSKPSVQSQPEVNYSGLPAANNIEGGRSGTYQHLYYQGRKTTAARETENMKIMC
jgi:hypothetical protein